MESWWTSLSLSYMCNSVSPNWNQMEQALHKMEALTSLCCFKLVCFLLLLSKVTPGSPNWFLRMQLKKKKNFCKVKEMLNKLVILKKKKKIYASFHAHWQVERIINKYLSHCYRQNHFFPYKIHIHPLKIWLNIYSDDCLISCKFLLSSCCLYK